MKQVCAGPEWRPGDGICGTCGRPTKNKWFCRGKKGDANSCRRIWLRNHWWSSARLDARERDGYKCVRCGSEERLEVNHITPLGDGSHSKMSCRHHLDGLETLCHNHHVEVTAQQRELRG